MRKAILAAACAGVLSLGAWDVSAAVIQWREGGSGTFNGNPLSSTTFDDTYVHTGTSAVTTNYNSSTTVNSRTWNNGITEYGLIAVKDMFVLLPKFSGSNVIQINSATLSLFTFGGNAVTMEVNRVTTDWLTLAGGLSEGNVTGARRDVANNLAWASGNFSSADFTTTGAATATWNTVFNGVTAFDVTAIIQDMYSLNTNYGMVVRQPTSVASGTQQYYSSERSTITVRPVLTIDYEYVPEPSAALVIAGAAGLMLRRRRTV